MGAVGSNAANGNVSSGSMILGGPQGASGVNLRGGMGKNFLEFPVLLYNIITEINSWPKYCQTL